MPSFTITRHIAAPPDVVFHYAADFERAPQRIRGIKKVELLTQGPVGVGTRFKETRIVFKREATETMEVVAFDPPRGYTLGAESCGCRYRIQFRFAPANDGTDVELKFDAEPLTFLARLMGFLMGRMIEMCAKESAKDLEDLKAAIEQGPQAAVAS
jgi:carbon monoxide dehydrogenase subunit G